MAKALKKRQPMSSVDRFFSGASIGAALAPIADEPIVSAVTPAESDEHRTKEPPAAHAETPPTVETAAAIEPEPASAANPNESTLAVEAAPIRPVIAPVAVPAAEPAIATIAEPIPPAATRPAIRVLPSRPSPMPTPERTAEPIDRQREFQLTRSADETLEDLMLIYKRATGAEVTRSHILRAILKAVSERMPELKREAQAIGPLKRPSNARGFEDAREEFEEQIKTAFLRGVTES
jgi:hypothetical protein